MDRREFFKRGLKSLTETAIEVVDNKVSNSVRWIRPPYAVAELEFLLYCTRCGECIDACPYHVIFPLPARVGAQVVGTPAMDILNKGCHLCEDWPCVNICKPEALKLPAPIPLVDQQTEDTELMPPPRMAMASINAEYCLPYQGPECGACNGSCPVSSALCWEQERPSINPHYCTGCGMCREACIATPNAIEIQLLGNQDRT